MEIIIKDKIKVLIGSSMTGIKIKILKCFIEMLWQIRPKELKVVLKKIKLLEMLFKLKTAVSTLLNVSLTLT